jgi:hypothetical protein
MASGSLIGSAYVLGICFDSDGATLKMNRVTDPFKGEQVRSWRISDIETFDDDRPLSAHGGRQRPSGAARRARACVTRAGGRVRKTAGRLPAV